MKKDRRVFSGYDNTLTHIGWYDKEFVKYVMEVEDTSDIQYHLRGENSDLRLKLGVCDGRGRMSSVCCKPDPEFKITIRMNTDGLAGLVRSRRKSKREGLSNEIIITIRKDKDVQAILSRVRKTFEAYMPIKGIVLAA